MMIIQVYLLYLIMHSESEVTKHFYPWVYLVSPKTSHIPLMHLKESVSLIYIASSCSELRTPKYSECRRSNKKKMKITILS